MHQVRGVANENRGRKTGKVNWGGREMAVDAMMILDRRDWVEGTMKKQESLDEVEPVEYYLARQGQYRVG
jgi:hypothetical protein